MKSSCGGCHGARCGMVTRRSGENYTTNAGSMIVCNRDPDTNTKTEDNTKGTVYIACMAGEITVKSFENKPKNLQKQQLSIRTKTYRHVRYRGKNHAAIQAVVSLARGRADVRHTRLAQTPVPPCDLAEQLCPRPPRIPPKHHAPPRTAFDRLHIDGLDAFALTISQSHRPPARRVCVCVCTQQVRRCFLRARGGTCTCTHSCVRACAYPCVRTCTCM